MKQTELMIGDFVNLSDTKDFILPSKVVELRMDKLLVILPNDTAYDIVDYNTISPIFLTYKIMKLNSIQYQHPVGGMPFYLFSESVDIQFNYQAFKADEAHIRMPVKYVHEVQHLLRMIGKEEMADNFKIE